MPKGGTVEVEDASAQHIKEAKLEHEFLELRAERGLDDPETLAAFFALFTEMIQCDADALLAICVAVRAVGERFHCLRRGGAREAELCNGEHGFGC